MSGRHRASPPDCVKNSERRDMVGDVMNTKERGSMGESREARGYRPDKRALDPAFGQRAKKRLA